tara:strand:+ start:107 stop:334 length:228 start_codon:yes stop_codon:yes gene_type:complete
MAKSTKVVKSSPGAFAKGGSGKMFGKQSAGPQKPGQSASMGSGGGKFAAGGKGKMAGFTGSKMAPAFKKGGKAGC